MTHEEHAIMTNAKIKNICESLYGESSKEFIFVQNKTTDEVKDEIENILSSENMSIDLSLYLYLLPYENGTLIKFNRS